MLRHLPPTAVPISVSDLRRGLNPPQRARTQFEAALGGYLSAHACKLAASGRTALYLLLKMLSHHSDRKEVVMPAYTCPALVRVTLDVGLQPRFVDISPHTLAFEEDPLEASVGPRTLAVICVHPFGIPQPLEHVRTLAQAAGAVIIEDAAQAMGARQREQPVGTQGDFGVFSLGPGKPLSTGGGGVLCAQDEHQAQLLEVTWEGLPSPSAAASAWTLSRLALFTLAFHPTGWWLATRGGLHRVGDQEASWGYSLRGLSDAQAAVGIALLDRLDAINRQRRENAGRIMERLNEIEFVHIPPPTPTGEPIYLRLPLLVDDEARRERLFRRLWQAGIGVGRMYRYPLPHYFPQVTTDTYPGASHIARHLLTLPTHHYLTDADVEHIARAFQVELSAG